MELNLSYLPNLDNPVLSHGMAQTMGDGDDGPAPGGCLQGADDAGFGICVEIGRDFIEK